ncbi:MAG TPA: FtsX-like permease family protein [Beutenbergiaceae bacterium]|nr:FtsX-like permease family protein [Beutenbergiaceae bacterium]
MLKITLQQMRSGWVRLLAAGIAIALGTGFVAATLLGGEAMKSAAYQSFTSEFEGADAVIEGAPLGAGEIDRAASVSGAAEAHTKASVGGEIGFGSRSNWGLIGAASPDAQLEAGELPGDGEIALRADLADRLGVAIGDDVALTVTDWDADEPTDSRIEARVSGLVPEATNFFTYGTDALVPESALLTDPLAPLSSEGPLAVSAAGGVSEEELQTALAEEFGSDYTVQTVTEVAEETTEAITGDSQALTWVLLGFAGVALAAAILVISNTFAVLVASRTRTLAMLRTIGASRSQVGGSVMLEALILGVVSSLAGLALGYGVIAGALAVVTRSLPDINVWQDFALTPAVWIATLATGIVITMLAGFLPARTATRVRPLEALRPEPVRLGTTAGKFRAAISLLAFLAGAAMLIGGVAIATGGDEVDDMRMLAGLGIGILGGFISVAGILLGSVFIISPLVRAVGALFGRGATAKVATMGAIRNPRRTATTSNALFIGVALVVMMGTGAATAKTSLSEELQDFFPVDVEAATGDGSDLTTGQLETLGATEGVEVYTPTSSAGVVLTGAGDGDAGIDEAHVELLTAHDSVPGSDAQESAPLTPGAALPNPEAVDGLEPGEILLPDWFASDYGLEVGDTVEVSADPAGDSASGEGEPAPLTFAGDAPAAVFLVAEPTFAELFPDPPVNGAWLRLTPEANPLTVIKDLEDAMTTLQTENPDAPVVQFAGGAVERATFEQVIDVLLLIVTAMLAVAVVIALVGVANTLSLSVLERRRESATLRAIGLTKSQLRGTLAIEGVIIAVVGALVGIAGGLAYGWAGAMTILGALGSVRLGVPWALIAVVAAVAIGAGLLASVIPARSATKVPPVAALAEE